MKEIKVQLRNEMYMTSLEDRIEEDAEVRAYDAIINELNIKDYGIGTKEYKTNAGRPKYNDKDMLKLFVYGYRIGIRTGRKLEDACKYDIRVKWLMSGAEPDANTINDYRKNNKDAMIKIFYAINKIFIKMGLLKIKEVSQDGFKIRACNSKEKNYTRNKLIDRIKRESKEIEEGNEEVKEFEKYIKELEVAEELEETEEKLKKAKEELEKINEKIEKVSEQKNKHEKLLNEMREKNISQISITDKESRLMKNNGSFNVAYNIQSAVDVEGHMTAAITLDNNPADIGSMNEIGKEINENYKEEREKDITYNTTDKGYNSKEDMIKCLEMGIVPQVTPERNKRNVVELETEYEPKEITEEEYESKRPEDIKKCLRAGVIPECYGDIINKIEIVKSKKIEQKENSEEEETRDSEEIRQEAIKLKTFERDIRTGEVYCPEGETLCKKSTNRGKERYCNKLACKRCKNPCTTSKYKTVDFKPGQKSVISKNSISIEARNVIERGKRKSKEIVKIELKIREDLIKKRMQTSEHSQGTMKTVDNHSYFNVRGKDKALADVSIHFMSSNIRRAINMIGTEKIIKELDNSIKNGILLLKKLIFI